MASEAFVAGMPIVLESGMSVPWKVGEPLQPPERQPLPDSMRS